MPITESELASAAVAPRVTLADVEGFIASEVYFTGSDGHFGAVEGGSGNYTNHTDEDRFDQDCRTLNLLTFCVLVLKNGFTVHGSSACASPENFNPKIGNKIARDNAVNQIWPLLGFELRSKLSKQETV